jgi:diguanylate cyclase
MKYQQNKELSAEYLRLALPLMSKHAAGVHPISYAVWYEYVSGINPTMNEHIDQILASGATINDEMIRAIYQRYVAEPDARDAEEVSASVQRVLADVSSSASEASQQADRFGSTLQRFDNDLTGADSADRMQTVAEEARRDTRSVRDAVSDLQNRLAASQREIVRLRQQVLRAREDARIDALTGLCNRKCFDDQLAECISHVDAQARGPSVLMGDIDFFKQVNDNYGHLLGDKVLRLVAQIIKGNVKGKDTAARYGGEEFVVLLPDTATEGARSVAEKIRATVAGSRIRRMDNNETLDSVTISFGVASYRAGDSPTELIARADAALYVAKANGRNSVSVTA